MPPYIDRLLFIFRKISSTAQIVNAVQIKKMCYFTYTTLLLIIMVPFLASSDEPQWTVGSIKFTGNEIIPDNILVNKMKLQPACLFNLTQFSLTELIDDITNLEKFYRSKGYLDVFISIDTILRNERNKRISIGLNVYEGPLITVDTILFTGDTFFKSAQLYKYSSINEGYPFDSLTYSQSAEILKDSIMSRGFMFAMVQRSAQRINHSDKIIINYNIDKGPLVFAGDIEFAGREKISEIVIQRELQFKQNQLLSGQDINESIQNLYLTGLFENVTIEPIDTILIPEKDSVTAPILITLKERDLYDVSAMGGYTSETGLYMSLAITYRNLFNRGHSITGSGYISINRLGVQLRYLFPWFLNKPIGADIKSFYYYRHEDAYEGFFYGGTFLFYGNIRKNNRYSIWLEVEQNSKLKSQPAVANEISEISDDATLLTGLSIGSYYNQFNRLEENRLYYAVKGEVSVPGIAHTSNFLKATVDLKSNYNIMRSAFVNNSSLYWGIVHGYGKDRGSVPVQELFRTGKDGVKIVRGYKESEISPEVNGKEVGGSLAFFCTLLELHFPIFLWFGGTFFIDTGKIWESYDDVEPGDLKWSVGPGIRFTVSNFIASLDYGVQLDNTHTIDGQLHFSMGLPF